MSDGDAHMGGGGDGDRITDDPPFPAGYPNHPVGDEQVEKNKEDEPPA